MFGCQSENSTEELNEFNGSYKCTAALKLHFDHSVKKTKKNPPKFVGKMQAMIDNDHSKSIRSIARDEEIKTFSISHTRWERANFDHRPWRTREKTALL